MRSGREGEGLFRDLNSLPPFPLTEKAQSSGPGAQFPDGTHFSHVLYTPRVKAIARGFAEARDTASFRQLNRPNRSALFTLVALLSWVFLLRVNLEALSAKKKGPAEDPP